MNIVKGHFNKAILYIGQVWVLIKLIWVNHPVSATTWSGLLIIASAFPALQIWLQKNLVNSIGNISLGNIAYMRSICLVITLYSINIISILSAQLQNYIFVRISETTNQIIKKNILQKAIDVSFEYYEQSEFYNRLMIANDSVARNSIEIVSFILIIIQQVISLFAVYGILAAVHWSLPMALLISSLPGIILLFISKKRRFQMMIDSTAIGREMNYTNNIIIKREYAREIRIFKIGEYLIERWEGLFNITKKMKLKQALYDFKGNFIGASILQISAAIVALLLIFQINKGRLTIGDYVALLSAVATVQGIFGTIGMNMGNIVEISLYNNALFDFLNIQYNSNLKSNKVFFSKTSFDRIVINNISFLYPGSKSKVLDGVSLTINRGEKIAIVGENGAGKTTLVNCILGLYKVTEGDIFFGETKISDIDENSLRENISVVFQDFAQYYYNIRENVGFGKLSKMNEDDQIINMLDKVGLKAKVEELQLGLETPLGKEFCSGEELSGGEWQRIAIARALIRNGEIVILDEPTASLDPMAELDIFNCFEELSMNKTSIVISHRLGPARFADRIIVLKDGKIIEEGNHECLMQLNGEYAHMYLSQSKWYQSDANGKLKIVK